MIAVQYGCDFQDIDAIMCVSHPLDSVRALHVLDGPIQKRLYMPIIIRSLKHLVKKSTFYEGEQREKALSAKSLYEFDDAVTSKNVGVSGWREYYEMLNLAPKCVNVKVPLLLFNADDDPFTSPKFIPVDEIKKSQFVAFVSTTEGGHVSFCEGMSGRASYIERFATNYFETVLKVNEK